jgi:enamine deaminase RidA (YjgF/YER057c/UK114 family)
MQASDNRDPAAYPPFLCVMATSSPTASTFLEAIESCLRDLEVKLAEVGCVLSDVANVRAYLPSDIMTTSGYADYNDVYNRFFHARGILKKPARATVGIDRLQRIEVKLEAFALSTPEQNISNADDAHARIAGEVAGCQQSSASASRA